MFMLTHRVVNETTVSDKHIIFLNDKWDFTEAKTTITVGTKKYPITLMHNQYALIVNTVDSLLGKTFVFSD